METLKYVLIATISLSLFYLAYQLIFRSGDNFKQMRYFLLSSMVLSMLIPISNFSIHTNILSNKNQIEKTQNTNTPTNHGKMVITGTPENTSPEQITSTESKSSTINWIFLLRNLYFLVTIIMLARVLAQILILVQQYLKSDKSRRENYLYITNSRFKNTFSFFNWIFIQTDMNENDDDEIIQHEKIHAMQLHSFDLMMVELLAAVMWFNPVVWLMRKEIQLVHEYLADEGALSTGIDKLRYQALLINQITEERLICLSSSFNHSLIKKRMIMITKSKFNSKTKLKILALVPVAALIFLGVACVNGQNKTDVVAAIAPTKMNVVYYGVENPIAIAVSGYDASELTVSVDNGTISGKNGNYIILPKRPGSLMVSVMANGKLIQESQFRVKTVPDPVAAIKILNGEIPKFRTEGYISKKELLAAGGVLADMKNFDFDLQFNVASFVLSATVPNSNTVREEISNTDKFSDTQIDLINSLVKNQKLMVEQIIAIGPDGTKRKLNSMVFTISGE